MNVKEEESKYPRLYYQISITLTVMKRLFQLLSNSNITTLLFIWANKHPSLYQNSARVSRGIKIHSEPQSWKTNVPALKLHSLGYVMTSNYVVSSLNKSSNSWWALNKVLLNRQLWSNTEEMGLFSKASLPSPTHLKTRPRHWGWPHYQILDLTTMHHYSPHDCMIWLKSSLN